MLKENGWWLSMDEKIVQTNLLQYTYKYTYKHTYILYTIWKWNIHRKKIYYKYIKNSMKTVEN